ncbi:hypothetical protein PR048_022206 [Dryococelus australis]|uniref:Uncharacterized protein n=1 Tax=Dryococelus australis TaxID=614101 RepID=A0ABQ9H0E6_9NEOP|nr:hypothetical protein PR048_022206 [Dryococelus australis]
MGGESASDSPCFDELIPGHKVSPHSLHHKRVVFVEGNISLFFLTSKHIVHVIKEDTNSFRTHPPPPLKLLGN